MKPLKVEERFVSADDDTRIASHVIGEGHPVLLCNGLGGSWRAWSHQIQYLSDRCRFVSWDYRGLYRSDKPRDADRLSVLDHARDGLAVLDAFNVTEGADRNAPTAAPRITLFGWSMGVQVALEMYRLAPERVASLVLINGVPGRPWESILHVPQMKHVMPRVLSALSRVPGLVQMVTRRMVMWPETIPWAKRIGFAGRTLDERVFQELAGSFAELDMGTYMRILELLGEHDASDVLADVDVPLLMVAGDRDLFTPRAAAERVVREVRSAELLVVPGGTHYVAVEFPELVNLRVEKFMRERGLIAGSA